VGVERSEIGVQGNEEQARAVRRNWME
jgi:hypothetical protein